MKSKILIGALILSVALNIFIIGFGLGKIRPMANRMKELSARTELNVRHLGPLLPKDMRRDARQTFRSQTGDLKDKFDERRMKELEIKALLTEETLDVEALKAAVARWQDLSDFLRAVPQNIMIDILPSASLEVRQKIAKELFSFRKGNKNNKGARQQRRGPPDGFPPPPPARGRPGSPADGPPPDGPPPDGPPK